MSEKLKQLVLPVSVETEALNQRIEELKSEGMANDAIVSTISDELIEFFKHGNLMVKEV